MPPEESAERVVVLGASDKRDRYSNQALRLLREHGHTVLPVHPALTEIEGLPCYPTLDAIEGQVDTVTVYVNPSILEKLADALVRLNPKRLILNPGTESDTAEQALTAAGIRVQRACTLVLLHTGSFSD